MYDSLLAVHTALSIYANQEFRARHMQHCSLKFCLVILNSKGLQENTCRLHMAKIICSGIYLLRCRILFTSALVFLLVLVYQCTGKAIALLTVLAPAIAAAAALAKL